MAAVAGLHATGDDRIATGGTYTGSREGVCVPDRPGSKSVEVRGGDQFLSVGSQMRTHILYRKPEDIGAFGLCPNSGTQYQDKQQQA